VTEAPACSFEVDADDIGWLTIDRPGGSANTLGRAVLLELQQLVAA
jgi:enoyl-CoA hydratase/carnithine racemase